MSKVQLSARGLQTPPSPIRKLAPYAQGARAKGLKVYPLNIGQPDIKSPPQFFQGLRMYKDSVLAYESSKGNESLCLKWSAYMNRTLGLETKPENFLITTGASEALIFTFMLCCDPGDEIVILDPTYANYIGFAAIAGVDLISVASHLEDNFALPPCEEIVRKITPATKAILLCSPNNPTGTVYTREELGLLLQICNERNLFLVVDETYREFVYDDRTPLSILHLEKDNPRIIVIDSLSKRFSLCGARIGCLYNSEPTFMAAALNLAQARLAAPTVEQFAAAHMLDVLPDNYIAPIIEEYQKRRDTLYSALCAIPGVKVQKPQGAFYTVVELPVLDAEDFAVHMLKNFSHNSSTTFVAPAAGFYMNSDLGQNKVRIAYVINSTEIVQAIEVLDHGLRHYKGV